MTETFITSRGTIATVIIPDRTPEEQKQRDKEIDESLIAIYRSMEKRGKGHLLLKVDIENA